MKKYGFGIDGGGTRSRIAVFDVDTGEEAGRFYGGSSNMYSVSLDEVFANLEILLRSTGVPLQQFCCGCLGSAGLSRPEERQVFTDFFSKLLPECKMYLCSDGETLMVGGLESCEGYSLIGGTGSLALGRAADGRLVRAGGLGYMLGDEGSALWIGWQAVQRSLRSLEGRDLPTCLLPLLLDHFGLKKPEDFVKKMHYDFQKSSVAAAARMVLAHVEDDPLAQDIACRAVQELVLLLESVMNQLPMDVPRAVLAGGVIENNAWLQQRLIEQLSIQHPILEIVMPAGDAVKGACILARA